MSIKPVNIFSFIFPASRLVARKRIININQLEIPNRNYKTTVNNHVTKHNSSIPFSEKQTTSSPFTATTTTTAATTLSIMNKDEDDDLEISKYVEGKKIQAQINELAKMPPSLITLKDMIEMGKNKTGRATMVSARFLRREVPIRLAHRIVDMQRLPFVVGCNPYIKKVYTLQLYSFDKLVSFPVIKTAAQETEFATLLRTLVDRNSNIIELLAKGAKECSKNMSRISLTNFLRQTLKSRIGIRLICEHYLAMRHHNEDFIGIIALNLSPKLMIQKCAEITQTMCDRNYGVTVPVEISGHVDTTFSFIPPNLEYILVELLKNSMRAVVEHAKSEDDIPPIKVIICKGESDVTIRISDCGGGINADILDNIFDYSFTTVEEKNPEYDGLMMIEQDPNGVMAGLGFGLPMARIYAEYFGGSMDIFSLEGYGCDIYLRLNHIGDHFESYEF